MARNKDLEHFRSELQEVDRQMGNIVNAVVAGFSQSAFAGKLAELEKEKAELEQEKSKKKKK